MQVPVLRPAILFASVILVSLLTGSGKTPDQPPFKAIYKDNRLALEIPYHLPRAGSGTLVTELLDPEDEVLAHSEQHADVVPGDGVWKQDLKPIDPLPFADLMWQRIRYRFQFSDEEVAAIDGITGVSEVLQRPLLHIIGQNAYLSGARAAIRVIVTDLQNHELLGKSSLRVELLNGDQPSILFEGRANRRGTVEADFRFPTGLTGDYPLHFVAETALGTTETTQQVHLEDSASILLTTEKRLYQPGQIIHVRSLVLNRADHHSVASAKLTFEIQDPRGNKVFKQLSETDDFGVASAEFPLADEVNLGAYQLHASLGNLDAPTNKADLSFTVDRYVLPKFKVAVNFADVDGKPKRDYRPGDHVRGTVQSDYFFGKPVANSEVTVKASSADVQMAQVASATGHTDKDGGFHFDLHLPGFFAGRLQNSGTAPVLIEASVKDTSGHAETHAEGVTVSESALLITAVPEGGSLIPGLQNQVYLLASYADGTPAVADLQVHADSLADQTVTTDTRGVAVIRITPKANPELLHIRAQDKQGNRVSTSVSLKPKSGMEQVLLRPDRAVYKTGDHMQLSVLSTAANGAAYLDIVKDGQTILTRDLDLANGRAELSIIATPEMSGALGLNVYRLGQDAQTIGDHRMVFVQPSGELRIQAIADAPVYKPGADAHIQFKVTNEHGQGVRAALGLQVVDEAVFALAEQRPGFAKVFFYLEQELLKPRYEIHSFGMPDAVEPTTDVELRQQDRAAQALFSATEVIHAHDVNLVYGRDLPAGSADEYKNRYQAAFENHVADLAQRASVAFARNPSAKMSSLLLEDDGRKPIDAWGTPLQIDPAGLQNGSPLTFRITSAGLDRQFGTADDATIFIDARSGYVYGGRGRQSLSVKLKHHAGTASDVAEVSGTITDITGEAVADAKVTLGERSTGTDQQGKFQFQGVVPGRYQIEVSARGFMLASRSLNLQSRDVAIVAGRLQVGSVAQTVEVLAEPPMLMANSIVARQLTALPLNARSVISTQKLSTAFAQDESAHKPADDTHVRSFFPEALYINPEIITDSKGSATISIPMADSITNWRMAMLASTTNGALGSASSAIKVFQDFFVDLDLPVTLTQSDRVTVPVAIYNYAGQRGAVTLRLEKDDWFDLSNETAEKTISVDAGKVGSASFTLEARRIGHFKLKLLAKMDGAAQRQDIVVREIEVVPNGREQNIVFNGQVDSTVQQTVRFPNAALPDASKLFVRLYPGPLSQVMEGMDAILRMPGGCFEQTSSSTYPNVLALDYMKRTKKLTPEVHAKAEGFIVNGYQRLLTFEVPGGGFSWFGQAPANKILTAYGLMEFHDMANVHAVDPNLIQRTSQWLLSQQQGDGSWIPDTSFINEGVTNRFNSDELRITAYIAWALANSGYRGPGLDRARQFIFGHLNSSLDSYTLAVLANFALDYGKDNALTQRVMQMLLAARVEKDNQVSWNSEETSMYGHGSSAAVETTGLATQALLKSNQSAGIARKALAFISSRKDATGNWGSTQATIMALRALLMASEASGEATGDVQVTLNGQTIETLALTAANGDLYRQFLLPNLQEHDANNVQISFKGSGGLAYQIVGRYFVPWDAKPNHEPLSIDVAYNRTKLAQNQMVNATATIRNNLDQAAKMVMVDLGIPPGFDLLTEDLDDLKTTSGGLQSGALEKYSLTATQAILYFNGFAPKSTLKLHFRLRAKYPIRAHTFQSRVYEYYDPSVSSVDRPKQFEVTGR